MLTKAADLIKKSFVERVFLSELELKSVFELKEEAIFSLASSICSASLPESDVVFFSSLLARIENNEKDFYKNLTSEAVFDVSPDGKCVIISSFVRGRFVFLGFLFEGKRYYLVQYLNCPVGFISVGDLAYMSTGRTNVNSLQAVKNLLYCWLESPNKSVFYEEGDNNALGLVLNTDNRPSHFFYEMLPALFNPNFDFFKDKIVYSFYRKGADFISSSCFFDNDVKEVVGNDVRLQNFIFENRVLAFQPGFRKFRGFYDCIGLCDRFLVELFSTHDLKDLFPVVWFSVLSEEKSWVEQNATFASIIKKFITKYEAPVFLFDGLTDVASGDNAGAQLRGDVLDIKEKVGEDFFYIDMHGLKSSDKIALASEVNIFLTSMGSDSLYPSRIANKPGLVHSSPDVTMFKKHIYSDCTIKIPPKKASFLEGQAHLRPDKRSYSIDQRVVEDAFWDVWEGLRNDS